MLFNMIKIGDRVEITWDKNKEQNAFISQVEEITDDGELVIYSPIIYGQIVKLPMRVNYEMLFFTEKGKIMFEAETISHFKERTLEFIKIKIISEGKRMQLREFYRHECLLPVKYTLLSDDESDEAMSSEMTNEGIIKDLSAGGIRFLSNVEMELGDKIKCIIALNDEIFISLAKIMKRDSFPKSNFKYHYRTQFYGMPEYEKEKIIKYIFNEQRKALFYGFDAEY